MGNCFPFIRKHQNGNREVTLAILGIDNAGKTTTAKSIKGDSLEGTVPTVGFDKIEFAINNFNINLFDLGGGKNIRAIWRNYLSEVYGLIYVIDSSDSSRIEETSENLSELFSDGKVKGKPVLLLANKQDKQCALDEGEIIEALNLLNIINENKIPCRLERCAATFGTGQKLDKSIKKGLEWLLGYVDSHMEELRDRVKMDMIAQRQADEEERAMKRERIRRNREQREREEETTEKFEEGAKSDTFPYRSEEVEHDQPDKCEGPERKTAHRADNLKSDAGSDFDKSSPQSSCNEESLSSPTTVGCSMRNQFYSPRGPLGSEEKPRPPSHLTPLKTVNRLEPIDSVANDPVDQLRKKKVKKRSRIGRRHRLAPNPLACVEGDAIESEEGGSSISRTPSRPDLFVTGKIYTLDELDEHELCHPVKYIGPNGDMDVPLR